MSETCATCAHNGCCSDLHHCGGSRWEDAEREGDDAERDAYEDWPDEYDKWLHDSEVWQESMDRRY